jgi:malate dehydrogenase (oxaloacetate-decarboxylating)
MQAEAHDDRIDRDVLEVSLTGQMLLEHPLLNKGTSFPEDERREFNLLGLLPQHVTPLEVQLVRTYENYCLKDDDLERYIFLASCKCLNSVREFFANYLR